MRKQMFELVSLEDAEFEELLAEGTWAQMERARDEALADAQEDYDDGRYGWRALRIQPAA